MKRNTLHLLILLSVLVPFNLSAQSMLAAAKKDGKWGFINEKGAWIIPPKYDKVLSFKDGLAAANKGYTYNPKAVDKCFPGKWGFINTKGEWVIKPKFESVSSFQEGLAKVNIGAAYRNYQGIQLMGGKWGFLQKDGTWFIEPNDTLFANFSEGLCAFKVPKGSYWGYMDKNKKVVVKPVYWAAHDFHEGLAAVMQQDFTFIFINKSGKQAFPKAYQKAFEFANNRAFVKETTGLPTFIDTRGTYFFKIENLIKDENIHLKFSEGLVKIPIQTTGNIKVGFADITGKWIIKPIYDLADDFHESLALVFKDRVYHFIDKKGKEIIDLKSEYVENPKTKIIFKGIPHPNLGYFSEGLCRVKDIDKWGFIDKSGQVAIPFQFENVLDFTKVEEEK